MSASPREGIFQPGDILNNTYRIEKLLGRGGTSEVYRARSEISGRVMAIKALRPEYASNEDFLLLMTREEDIRDVHHDAIVRYYDTQRMLNGVVYLVMDYVDGPSLELKLQKGGMSEAELLVLGERVCQGLIAAHARNIVHRDLSPDNIILRNDNPAEAVIIDFGIAKDTNPGAETIVGNEFAGKFSYAAPEQLNGQTDARSDIYALGALLLATFRGEKPCMGNSPMEVVKNKLKPLDLDGVPEPLRGLIARMCETEPDKRFGSSAELLEEFRKAGAAAPAPVPSDPLENDEATVISPRAARASRLPSSEASVPPASAPQLAATDPAPVPASRGRVRVVPALAVLLLVGATSGAYFSGMIDGVLGPRHPMAQPFTLTVERPMDGGPDHATGHVPSLEFEAALTARLLEMGGTAELSLASGDIHDGWDTAVEETLARINGLEEFRLAVENDRLELSGLAPDRDTLSAVEAAFADGFPGDLQGSLDLQLGPRFLTEEMLAPLLHTNADCGRLRLLDPPSAGYGLDDTIIIVGQLASDAQRDALATAITAIAGERPTQIETDVLNPALCRIDAVLPSAGPGGFDVRMGFGDRPDANPSGSYRPGDNPVIDVVLPDAVEGGYLQVSVVDVKGVVFHLLPNSKRPDNSIATLRREADGDLIRVAYTLEEARGTNRLAFSVDGSTLGKSKVVVVHSDTPLFSELRPTTESAAGYAKALSDAQQNGELEVNTMDTALLITER